MSDTTDIDWQAEAAKLADEGVAQREANSQLETALSAQTARIAELEQLLATRDGLATDLRAQLGIAKDQAAAAQGQIAELQDHARTITQAAGRIAQEITNIGNATSGHSAKAAAARVGLDRLGVLTVS